MSHAWMPSTDRFFPATDPSKRVEGPSRIFGYDGKIHPYTASTAEWRAFYMRKARWRGTHTKGEWEALRAEIGCCASCGATDRPLAKDHIVPVSRGGCDCIQNLQPLCHSCNSSKCAR